MSDDRKESDMGILEMLNNKLPAKARRISYL